MTNIAGELKQVVSISREGMGAVLGAGFRCYIHWTSYCSWRKDDHGVGKYHRVENATNIGTKKTALISGYKQWRGGDCCVIRHSDAGGHAVLAYTLRTMVHRIVNNRIHDVVVSIGSGLGSGESIILQYFPFIKRAGIYSPFVWYLPI